MVDLNIPFSVTIKIRANSVFLLTAFNVMQLQQEIFC